MDQEPLIRYKGVDIYQQALGVLTKVDFELRQGEFVYLIGKVGSGKSTFLKTIYGEVDIAEGEAHVLGLCHSRIRHTTNVSEEDRVQGKAL